MKVYYAHAMCLYGTEQEKEELTLLRKNFQNAEIVNPADHQNNLDGTEEQMDFYLSLVERCDIVVFSRLLGKITSGVGKEVNHALKKGKEVYMLDGASLFPIKSLVKYISRQNTRELYLTWVLQNLDKKSETVNRQ